MARNLRYVGNGAFITGVPAQDLRVPDDLANQLLESGLYEDAVESAPDAEEAN